jgi:hypothetical protein
MSVFKSQFSRAVTVIPSTFSNVPSPILLAQGANTYYDILNPNVLEDSSAAFFINPTFSGRQYAVNLGDVVYCYATGLSGTIVEVIDKKALLLNNDIFTGSVGAPYFIYQEGAQTGIGNTGCNLYISDADANYEVVTIGGDTVMFFKPQVGTVLPVQVKKVISGGGCIALW